MAGAWLLLALSLVARQLSFQKYPDQSKYDHKNADENDELALPGVNLRFIEAVTEC